MKLSGIQQGLHQVQKLLQDAPELKTVPKSLTDVITSVASFGSRLRDLEVTVGDLKEAETKLLDVQRVLQQNITNTEVK